MAEIVEMGNMKETFIWCIAAIDIIFCILAYTHLGSPTYPILKPIIAFMGLYVIAQLLPP